MITKLFEIIAVTKAPIDKTHLATDPSVVLQNILNIAYFFGAVIAVIAIIVAGYNFTTSAYDSAKVAQAKNAILYSVIGLIFIIIAFVITSFVIQNFG